MTGNKVRLKVGGHVDLSDLRKAVDALAELLDDLVAHAEVNWEITHLAGCSLDLVCEGEAETAEGKQRIEEAIREYDRIGEATSNGIPLDDYPDNVIEQIAKITSVIRKGHATSVVMSSGNQEWTIRAPVEISIDEALDSIPIRAFVRTSVRGTVSAVNDLAGQIQFTLEQAHTRRKFRCWAPTTYRNQIWDCGRNRKWITVEGRVNRTAKKSPTVTVVTDIFVHDDYEPGDWRKAIGCIS